jgi:hypothetical protein
MKQDDLFNERISKIVDWVADPFDKRTTAEVAKEFDITKDGLRSYMRCHEERIAYEVDKRRKKYLPKMATCSMKALSEMIQKKNMRAIELGLTISGVYTPRSEITQTTRNETEQKAYVEALLERLKKQEKPLAKDTSQTNAPEEKS